MRATLRTARSFCRENSRPSVNRRSCTPTCANDSTCTSSCMHAVNLQALDFMSHWAVPAAPNVLLHELHCMYSKLSLTALGTKKFVLTSKCPYSLGPLQSECINWSPMALSLHQSCPYMQCPYKENLLYPHKMAGASPAPQHDNSSMTTAACKQQHAKSSMTTAACKQHHDNSSMQPAAYKQQHADRLTALQQVLAHAS